MDRRSFLAAAAAAPLALRLPRVGPLAYVTADLDASVAVVDLEHGTVVHRIRTRQGPRSIERVGGAAVAAHTVLGVVSILRGGDVVHELESGFAEPRYTAASADGRYAFVTDAGDPALVSVDVDRGAVVGRAKLKLWPRHLSRHGNVVLAALGTASSELAVVDVSDPRRPSLVRYRRAPFAVHDVGFAPGGRLWLTSGVADAVWCGRILAAGSPPQHVTFLERRAYVTSGGDGTVRTHRLDGSLVHETRVPVGSYNVQAGAGLVFTPSLDAGTLTVVDGRTIHVAQSSHDACLMHA